ncbi:hypothetical protein ACJ5NV_08865 [Loktanella agnita]|uniref:hypothetical protein n=1 Tax=Loktanella agnita TaxID=287097 RepID=UPI00398763AB
MQLTEIMSAISGDPEQMIRGIVRIFHFIGLAMGLGAATLLDMMILRFFLGRDITSQNVELFIFFADLVAVGLKMLWITGFGFLLYYWAYEPVKLGNEKVWAKMTIVAILSINGVFLHKAVIPFLAQQIGQTMLHGLPLHKRMLFITAGMISFVSWYAPLVIANLPHLNFQVPMIQILGVYAITLIGVLSVAYIGLLGHFVAGVARPREQLW